MKALKYIIFLCFINTFINAQDIKTGWIYTIDTEFMEYTRTIKKTYDGGLLVLTYQWDDLNYKEVNSIQLIKLNKYGEEKWTQSIDLGFQEYPNDFEFYSTNEIIITGRNWTAKLDTNGNIKWQIEHFNDLDPDRNQGSGNDIEIFEGNIFITGTKRDSVFLMKVSTNGSVFWKYTYSYFPHAWAEGNSVEIRNNDEIVIGADVYEVEGGDHVYSRAGLYFINLAGQIKSFEIYECNLPECYGANPLVDMEINNNMIFILGKTFIPGRYEDAYLMAINLQNEVQWVNYYDDGNVFGVVNDLYVDDECNLLVCGAADQNNFWVFKCDTTGDLLWEYKYGLEEHLGKAYSITNLDSNEYAFIGFHGQMLGSDKAYVVQIGRDVISNIKSSRNVIDNYIMIQNYPNPFNTTTNIEYNLPRECNVLLSIYNSLGQNRLTLVDDFNSAGYHAVSFNASNYASGVYCIELLIDGKIQSLSKMLLIK